jgi:choline trimethylamine-lyase
MAVGIAEKKTSEYAQEALASPQLREYSERCSRLLGVLQQRMTQTQLSWGSDRTVVDDPDVAAQPLVVRQAMAFEAILTAMPIGIESDDLIVGNNIDDGRIVRINMPEYASATERERATKDGSPIDARLSHKTPYYYDVLDRGLLAILGDVEGVISETAAQPPSAERDETLAEFRAILIEGRAVIAMANRYADMAENQAEACTSSQRARELRRMAEVCRRVPAHPAGSFHEAVQSFWFVNYALFSTNTHLSCGRIDQYLLPYLHDDLENERVSMAVAQELVDCLWLRFNDRAQIRRESFFVPEAEAASIKASGRGGVVVDRSPHEGRAGHRIRFGYATDGADAINHFGQNILLSGIRPDGTDGTSALTYLCLNALEKFPFTSPVVTARVHRGSPPVLLTRVAEVLKSGGGMPYVNNDDILVKGYSDLGVPVVDARDYANSNCWETMIEGKSDQELIRGMNFLLFLELVLNRGVSKMLGHLGIDTGDPLEFVDFVALMDAWKAQLDRQVKEGIDLIGKGVADGSLEHSSHGRNRYNPFLTALTHDCIARKRDVIRGGARYRIWHVMGEGVADAIDAMAAIKRLVFDERSVALATLLDALRSNWDGYEDLRQLIVHRSPKFANNDPYADDIGREMMRYFVERSRHHAARYPDIIFPMSVGTFSWFAMIGREVAASADGRRDGEPIAANFSPAPGTDVSGPTAAIGSYASMHVSELAAGAPLDLRLSASSVNGKNGTNRLAGLLKAFVNIGGNMLTVTVTDVEELRRAMKEPEKHRHLRVRMGGWSAYFVALSEEQQRLHISRVEHGLV